MKKTLIQHKVVEAGGAATIEFTNIPQTYDDLYLVVSGRTTYASTVDFLEIYPNGSTSNLSARHLKGDGAAASGAATVRNYINGASATSDTFGNLSFYIPNYKSPNAKSISTDAVSENNATNAYQIIQATIWNDTTAISSIELNPVYGNFVQYSSASLYGVSKYNTSAAPKASGGIISYDSVNDKWVHVFAASGTFTPSEDLTAEYVVVAGGGSGGGDGANAGASGGGGAGGYRSSVSGESSGGGASAETPLSLTASTGYTVTVGAGGSPNTNGSNTAFHTITSTGGGRGGERATTAPSVGGSGGGGYGQDGNAGAAGTANQGYAGGSHDGNNAGSAAGGGGAGGVGQNANTAGSTRLGGAGGSGVTSSITGSAIARAGGGGGGGFDAASGAASAGGGEGGDGSDSTGKNGLPGYGGGGGGGGNVTNTVGGNGGSGIVIVRYSA